VVVIIFLQLYYGHTIIDKSLHTLTLSIELQVGHLFSQNYTSVIPKSLLLTLNN